MLQAERKARSSHARRLIAVLFPLYLYAYLDRNLINVFLPDIQADFGLGDSELGLLAGTAFALGLSLAIIPVGLLADRWSKRGVMVGGIILWSAMTFLCGFSWDYQSFFVFRTGVGVGEAVLVPIAYAAISESVDALERPRVLSLVWTGSVFGLALAMGVGGLFDEAAPVGGVLRGEWMGSWRSAFKLVGAIGFFFAVLPLLLPAVGRVRPSGERAVSVFSFFIGIRSFAGPYLAAVVPLSMLNVGLLSWLPTFYVRTFGHETASIGPLLAGISLVAGLAGALLVGSAISRLSIARGRDLTIDALLVGGLVMLPITALTLSPLLGDYSLVGAGVIYAYLSGVYVLTGAAAMAAIPPAIRSQVLAVYSFLIAVTGMTLGSFVFGAVSDLAGLAPDQFWIPAMATAVSLLIVSSLAMAMCRRPYQVLQDDKYSFQIKRLVTQGERKENSHA